MDLEVPGDKIVTALRGLLGSRALTGALYLLMAGMIAAAVLQPVRSYDLGWHLATGRLIVEQGRIPSSDPFSFTRAGAPWLDHEWLFQVTAFLLNRFGGWRALLGADLVLALGTGLLLVAWMRKERVGHGVLAILLVLSMAGARFRFDARPEMASLFFMVFLFSILHGSREPEARWRVWLLPPLFAVWGNTHPGAVLGAALLVLWMGAEWGQGLLDGKGFPGGIRRAAICLVSSLGVLANPWGWRLLRVPLEIRDIVLSGHAPNMEWAPPDFQQFPLFFLAVAAALVVLGIGFREVDFSPALVTAVVSILAFQHLRNLGFFFLLLPLALARPAASLEKRIRFPEGEGRLLAAALLALVSLHFVRGNLVAGERGYLDLVEPRRAVDFMESHHVGGRLFNDVLFGGYLIWRRYPGHRVFIDGRNEIYEPLLGEIFEAVNDGGKWQALLERHRIDAALLRRGQMQSVKYPPSHPGDEVRTELRAFSAAHFPASRWALVYWDDHALLFVHRDDPAAAPLLAREYRIHPDDLPHTLALLARGELNRATILEEIDRNLRGNAACRSAISLRAVIERAPAAGPVAP